MSVVVVATITPKPEHRDEVIAAMKKAVPLVHEEDGCELYALHVDDKQLVMVERWTTPEALKKHGTDSAGLRVFNQAIDGKLAELLDLPFASETFDFATAFMSLMDMPDHGVALKEAARVLKPGGFFQFSIIHPCFSPPHRRVLRDAQGKVSGIEIGRYFEPMNGQLNEWMFSTLPAKERARTKPFLAPMFHRTLSSWVDLICGAGPGLVWLDCASAEPIDASSAAARATVALRKKRRRL